LISAKRENGKTTHVKIHSEKGGKVLLINPFETDQFETDFSNIRIQNGLIELKLEAGKEISLWI
jgi:hypothetical protein